MIRTVTRAVNKQISRQFSVAVAQQPTITNSTGIQEIVERGNHSEAVIEYTARRAKMGKATSQEYQELRQLLTFITPHFQDARKKKPSHEQFQLARLVTLIHSDLVTSQGCQIDLGGNDSHTVIAALAMCGQNRNLESLFEHLRSQRQVSLDEYASAIESMSRNKLAVEAYAMWQQHVRHRFMQEDHLLMFEAMMRMHENLATLKLEGLTVPTVDLVEFDGYIDKYMPQLQFVEDCMSRQMYAHGILGGDFTKSMEIKRQINEVIRLSTHRRLIDVASYHGDHDLVIKSFDAIEHWGPIMLYRLSSTLARVAASHIAKEDVLRARNIIHQYVFLGSRHLKSMACIDDSIKVLQGVEGCDNLVKALATVYSPRQSGPPALTQELLQAAFKLDKRQFRAILNKFQDTGAYPQPKALDQIVAFLESGNVEIFAETVGLCPPQIRYKSYVCNKYMEKLAVEKRHEQLKYEIESCLEHGIVPRLPSMNRLITVADYDPDLALRFAQAFEKSELATNPEPRYADKYGEYIYQRIMGGYMKHNRTDKVIEIINLLLAPNSKVGFPFLLGCQPSAFNVLLSSLLKARDFDTFEGVYQSMRNTRGIRMHPDQQLSNFHRERDSGIGINLGPLTNFFVPEFIRPSIVTENIRLKAILESGRQSSFIDTIRSVILEDGHYPNPATFGILAEYNLRELGAEFDPQVCIDVSQMCCEKFGGVTWEEHTVDLLLEDAKQMLKEEVGKKTRQ